MVLWKPMKPRSLGLRIQNEFLDLYIEANGHGDIEDKRCRAFGRAWVVRRDGTKLKDDSRESDKEIQGSAWVPFERGVYQLLSGGRSTIHLSNCRQYYLQMHKERGRMSEISLPYCLVPCMQCVTFRPSHLHQVRRSQLVAPDLSIRPWREKN